jgi:hypothetical protein
MHCSMCGLSAAVHCIAFEQGSNRVSGLELLIFICASILRSMLAATVVVFAMCCCRCVCHVSRRGVMRRTATPCTAVWPVAAATVATCPHGGLRVSFGGVELLIDTVREGGGGVC